MIEVEPRHEAGISINLWRFVRLYFVHCANGSGLRLFQLDSEFLEQLLEMFLVCHCGYSTSVSPVAMISTSSVVGSVPGVGTPTAYR